MRRSTGLAVLVVLALVTVACSGSDGGTTTAGGSTTTGPGTTSAADTITIDASGGTADAPGGATIEALPGSFPDGTELSIATAEDPPLPEDAEAVGPTISITASAQPDIPVIVSFPVPDGSDPARLALLHTADDGAQQVIGGWVEDDTFSAALPSFSRSTPVDLGFALQGILRMGDIPIDLTSFLVESVEEGQFDQLVAREWVALITGELESPAQRSTRIVGPTELNVGETATYTATDFIVLPGNELFVDQSWGVHGGAVAIDSRTDGGVFLEAVEEGRAVVTVDVTDPLTGATAFATLTIHVTDDAIGLTALASTLTYKDREGEGPAALLIAHEGTAPYTFAWSWSDGASGSGTTDTGQIDVSHTSVTSDIVLTATVTDSEGFEASTVVAFTAVAGQGRPDGMLVGPTRVEAGETVTYEIRKWNPGNRLPRPLAVQAQGVGAHVSIDGDAVSVVFEEAGTATLWLIDGDGELLFGTPVIVGGDAAPALARVRDPGAAQVGSPAAIVLEAQGGDVADFEGFLPRRGTVDFGDGTVEEVEFPPTAATEWARLDLEHTYEEEGDFTITLVVTTPDDQEATGTAAIQVTGGFRAVGGLDLEGSETSTIIENRVVLVVDGDTAEMEAFQYVVETVYKGFTLDAGGNEETFIADCLGTRTFSLRRSDLTFDPAEGAIEGTLRIQDTKTDVGSECPFGGSNWDDIRDGTVIGIVEGDTVTLELTFPPATSAGFTITATLEVR